RAAAEATCLGDCGAPIRLVRLRVPGGAAGLRRAARRDQVVEDRSVAVARSGDVAGRDLLASRLDEARDLARREELGNDLALVAFLTDWIGDRVAALDKHPFHELVDVGQGLGGCVGELLLEGLPLALPLVPIEARLDHRLPASPPHAPFKPVD